MTTNLFTLIEEATQLLLDRQPIERDLIYYVAILTDEERAAIAFAYRSLKDDESR